MGTFKAWVVEKNEAGQSLAFRDFDDADLMDGDVTVRVTHSTLNYKDGLALTGKSPVVRRFPMIPGIDFSGIVEASDHPEYRPGDAVVLTGWGVGETHLGAYAQRARVRGDWLVPLPQGLTAEQAMAVGTAGYTAMLCCMALDAHGVKPEHGPVIVTGASGGVGSAAIQLAKRRGAEVIAVSGAAKADEVRAIGADRVVDRNADLVAELGRDSIDLAVDLVAGPAWPQLLDVLRTGGRYVTSGAIAGPLVELDVRTLYLKDLTLFGCTFQEDEVFANLIGYIERGEIRPAVAKTYPLADIAQAQTDFLAKMHTGKLVLIPPQPTR